MNLGLSGRLTRATIGSPLTPLFLLAAIAVGLLALVSIPREEEPQISVPMVDIMVAAPGLRAPDAVELVGKPLETIVKSVADVELDRALQLAAGTALQWLMYEKGKEAIREATRVIEDEERWV